MTVRELAEVDLPKINKLHQASGFEYDMPHLNANLFPVRQVVSDDDGFAMGIFARKTLEAFFVMDPSWRSPMWRWQAFQCLHEGVRLDALQKGYVDVQAMIPPQIEKQFGRRLLQLGWRKNLWTCYSRDL